MDNRQHIRSAIGELRGYARWIVSSAGPRARAALADLGAFGRWLRESTVPRVRRVTAFARKHRPSRKQTGIGLAALAAIVMLLWWRCGLAGCPDVGKLVSYQPGGGSVLLDRNGQQFADLRPVDRVTVEIATLPPYVGAAFVAVEDKRFFEHGGVDIRRVGGSLLANLKAGEATQGFSTISMQLARNVWQDRLPARERTLRRKLLEIRVARDIEDRFNKNEILELYMNHIYFGGGAYGVEAASVSYFRKHARDLTLGEAALLAALPKAPTTYDPRRNPELALARRDLVLDLMVEQNRIAAHQAEAAKRAGLLVAMERALLRRAPSIAPHFVEMVRRELEERVGEQIYRSPMRVRTTLDIVAQQAAYEELERQLRSMERGALGRLNGPSYTGAEQTPEGTAYLQGAIVLLDARAGDVIALVGGRDFIDSRFNRATDARRQAGSSFKPFVYAAALEQGMSPSQPIADSPIQLISNGAPWSPRNFDGEYHGRMSMREALVHSQNVPTVRLARAVGEDEVIAVATRLGIRSTAPSGPMIALGIEEVSPLAMAVAYTAFATLGDRAQPRTVLSVTEKDDVIWESEPRIDNVLAPHVAFVLTDMLRDAVERGTGQAVRATGYTGLVAGKTGTTNDAADTWFVGYTPDVVGAVWIGFDRRRAIAADATGGRAAAPVWGRMMQRIKLKRGGSSEWPVPEGLMRRNVDPATGLVLAAGCRPRQGRAAEEWFQAGDAPTETCPRGASDGDGLDDVVGGLWRSIRRVFSRDRNDAAVEVHRDDGSTLGTGMVRTRAWDESRDRATRRRGEGRRSRDSVGADDDDENGRKQKKRKKKDKD